MHNPNSERSILLPDLLALVFQKISIKARNLICPMLDDVHSPLLQILSATGSALPALVANKYVE
jgi:hypothetical protein